MSIPWEDSYSVGIEKIDNQHKQIIALLNKLVDGIHENEYNDTIAGVITDLIEYSNYHFKLEEDLFLEYDYEEAEPHIKKHQDFRAKIMYISQSYNEDKLDACVDLIDFLEDWFIDHIIGTDKRYVGIIKTE